MENCKIGWLVCYLEEYIEREMCCEKETKLSIDKMNLQMNIHIFVLYSYNGCLE